MTGGKHFSMGLNPLYFHILMIMQSVSTIYYDKVLERNYNINSRKR